MVLPCPRRECSVSRKLLYTNLTLNIAGPRNDVEHLCISEQSAGYLWRRWKPRRVISLVPCVLNYSYRTQVEWRSRPKLYHRRIPHCSTVSYTARTITSRKKYGESILHTCVRVIKWPQSRRRAARWVVLLDICICCLFSTHCFHCFLDIVLCYISDSCFVLYTMYVLSPLTLREIGRSVCLKSVE